MAPHFVRPLPYTARWRALTISLIPIFSPQPAINYAATSTSTPRKTLLRTTVLATVFFTTGAGGGLAAAGAAGLAAGAAGGLAAAGAAGSAAGAAGGLAAAGAAGAAVLGSLVHWRIPGPGLSFMLFNPCCNAASDTDVMTVIERWP